MEITTRSAAIDRGDLLFFTGQACKYGHTAPRYTSGGNCVECVRLKNEALRIRIRERRAAARASAGGAA